MARNRISLHRTGRARHIVRVKTDVIERLMKPVVRYLSVPHNEKQQLRMLDLNLLLRDRELFTSYIFP